MSDERSSVGVLDAVAVAVCTLGLLAIWAFQLRAVPIYRAMFADFGSTTALPTITLIVLQPIVAAIASVVVLGLLGAGLASRIARRRELGAALLLFAVMVPIVTVPLMLVAMYAPLWELAGNIR